MTVHRVPLADTPFFTPIFRDYLRQQPALERFYRHPPTPDGFAAAIEAKKDFPAADRQRLQRAWRQQYADLPQSRQVADHLDALTAPETFTVTTGHQLNLFSGPLYFIYKLVTVINLARQLQRHHPGQRFVPVYWMATEDHDFAEINHFTLFGKTHTWSADQRGAVGRFRTTDLDALFAGLPEAVPLFERAYRQQPTLAAATRAFVNELFGNDGLLVLDADDDALKTALTDVARGDLFDHTTHRAATDTNQALEEAGYRQQIMVREVNLFYLDGAQRERIERTDDGFKVVHTELTFSAAAMEQLLAEAPGRLSPNVALRPLYQELLLPNVGYVGGPAEVAYWLQLRAVFDAYGVPMPVVMPRNFALVVNGANQRKVEKLGLPTPWLLRDEEDLRAAYLEQTLGVRVDLADVAEALAGLFDGLQTRVTTVDPTLAGFVGAEGKKAEKLLENIAKRVAKAEEQREATALQQIAALKEKLFPGGKLQERTENFLSFFLNDPAFLQRLLDVFDPFDHSFYILTDDNA